MNPIIDNLINNIAIELKEENQRKKHEEKREFDMQFILSILIQKANILEESLLKDIRKYEYEVQIEERREDDWENRGVITIFLVNPNPNSEMWVDKYLPSRYKIEILGDECYWGYCQCTSKDKDYNPVHSCCGHGCDWTAPAFSITYENDCGYAKWDGDQSDYWRMREQINKQIFNANEIKEKEKVAFEKERLENQLQEIQERIKLLSEI